MAMDIAAAAAEIVDMLVEAGVSATVDLRDLNTPGVFVPLPTLAYRFHKGDATATWRPVAAVAKAGRAQELTELSALLDAVQDALGGIAVTAAPVELTALAEAGSLPGYELTFTTRILNTP